MIPFLPKPFPTQYATQVHKDSPQFVTFNRHDPRDGHLSRITIQMILHTQERWLLTNSVDRIGSIVLNEIRSYRSIEIRRPNGNTIHVLNVPLQRQVVEGISRSSPVPRTTQYVDPHVFEVSPIAPQAYIAEVSQPFEPDWFVQEDCNPDPDDVESYDCLKLDLPVFSTLWQQNHQLAGELTTSFTPWWSATVKLVYS